MSAARPDAPASARGSAGDLEGPQLAAHGYRPLLTCGAVAVTRAAAMPMSPAAAVAVTSAER